MADSDWSCNIREIIESKCDKTCAPSFKITTFDSKEYHIFFQLPPIHFISQSVNLSVCQLVHHTLLPR